MTAEHEGQLHNPGDWFWISTEDGCDVHVVGEVKFEDGVEIDIAKCGLRSLGANYGEIPADLRPKAHNCWECMEDIVFDGEMFG